MAQPIGEFTIMSAAKLGEEPDIFKILVYNQLTSDEVAKASLPIDKLIYWDITASLRGKTAVDAPHVTVYWYGPHVSSEKGTVVHMKSVKIDPKFTESIREVVESKVGGTASVKENGVEFKDFIMKISYNELADLARTIGEKGNLSCEISLEYGKVTKEEKHSSSFPKTKILGEKALEK